MQDAQPVQGVIPAASVRRLSQSVRVDCGDASSGQQPMTVIPLQDGERIAGLEVRCRCGNAVVVECRYEDQP